MAVFARRVRNNNPSFFLFSLFFLQAKAGEGPTPAEKMAAGMKKTFKKMITPRSRRRELDEELPTTNGRSLT